MKVRLSKKSISIRPSRAWEIVCIAGFVSGLISSLSRMIGIPLDKQTYSILFFRAACLSISGQGKTKCLIVAYLISIACIVVSWIIIFLKVRKVKKVWKIPGWAAGLLLYAMSFFLGYLLLLRLLG
jgi:hypothetical protein